MKEFPENDEIEAALSASMVVTDGGMRNERLRRDNQSIMNA